MWRLFLLLVSLALAGTLRGEAGKALREVDARTWFAAAPSPLPAGTVRSDPASLAAVAAEALRYRRAAPEDPGVGAGLPGELGLDDASLESTLQWVVDVAAQDPSRLQDPAFLDRCLEARRWTPDRSTGDSARWGDAIRLTRYLVYDVAGSPVRTAAYPYALYAVPDDEEGLSEAEAEAKKAELLRFRYTRQQVVAGVYLEGGAAAGRARPLVWLDRERHEQAILQGTIAVTLPGESAPHLYNVHRPNGIPYDRSITDTKLQPRYWYFREVERVGGWGGDPVPKIGLAPGVAVAGDVYNLGLGRLIALHAADGLRLVVLADTGGAFASNLHQLDLYTGIFPDAASFSAATRAVGDRAQAWLVVAHPEREGCAAAPTPG